MVSSKILFQEASAVNDLFLSPLTGVGLNPIAAHSRQSPHGKWQIPLKMSRCLMKVLVLQWIKIDWVTGFFPTTSSILTVPIIRTFLWGRPGTDFGTSLTRTDWSGPTFDWRWFGQEFATCSGCRWQLVHSSWKTRPPLDCTWNWNCTRESAYLRQDEQSTFCVHRLAGSGSGSPKIESACSCHLPKSSAEFWHNSSTTFWNIMLRLVFGPISQWWRIS